MKPTFIYVFAIAVLMSTGCTSTPKRIQYKQIYESNIPLNQAIASCNYERQLSREADARAGVENGLLRQMLQEKSGYNLSVLQLCLRRYGWDVEEHDIPSPTNQGAKKYTTGNTPLRNGNYACKITKNIKGGVINEWKLIVQWPNAQIDFTDLQIPFEFQRYGNTDEKGAFEFAYIRFMTPNKDTLMQVYYDGNIWIDLKGQRVEAACNF